MKPIRLERATSAGHAHRLIVLAIRDAEAGFTTVLTGRDDLFEQALSIMEAIAHGWHSVPAREIADLTIDANTRRIRHTNGADQLTRTVPAPCPFCGSDKIVVHQHVRGYYDVDYSRERGAYIYHMSGAGGSVPPEVSGIYAVSGASADVIERPSALVHEVAQRRNATRRLCRIPPSFKLEDGWDFLDWLEHNGIHGDAVWCATCRDFMHEESLCDHTWWCDRNGPIGDFKLVFRNDITKFFNYEPEVA